MLFNPKTWKCHNSGFVRNLRAFSERDQHVRVFQMFFQMFLRWLESQLYSNIDTSNLSFCGMRSFCLIAGYKYGIGYRKYYWNTFFFQWFEVDINLFCKCAQLVKSRVKKKNILAIFRRGGNVFCRSYRCECNMLTVSSECITLIAEKWSVPLEKNSVTAIKASCRYVSFAQDGADAHLFHTVGWVLIESISWRRQCWLHRTLNNFGMHLHRWQFVL